MTFSSEQPKAQLERGRGAHNPLPLGSAERLRIAIDPPTSRPLKPAHHPGALPGRARQETTREAQPRSANQGVAMCAQPS